MSVSRVVVVGAGQAGVQLVASLRQLGFEGEVVLASDERRLPYQRPPLSKELLLGARSEDEVALRSAGFYSDKGIEVRDAVRMIDRERRLVHFESGESLPYSQLVLCTGSRPRELGVLGAELDGVMALHTVEDALSLKQTLACAASLAVVGGGFIGLEVAAAASSLGLHVTVLEALDRTMARAVSPAISEYLSSYHRSAGVDLRHGVRVAAVIDDGEGRAAGIELEDGEVIAADAVLLSVGAVPNTELAVQAGLTVADGVVVDEYLRTSDPSVYAVGDCCSFPWRGGPVRLESVQNASDQARCVAASITGTLTPYTAIPWFWSHQGASKLQIAGLTMGHDSTVVRGDQSCGPFSVLCFCGDELVGVESINSPSDHIAARKLLALGVTIERSAAGDPQVALLEAAVH